MKMNIYSVKDVKAEEFGPLFMLKNNELALRGFRKEMEKTEYIMEYDLYRVGSFDTETGKFRVPENPELLITGSDLFNEIMKDAGDNAVKLRLNELAERVKDLSPEELEKLIKKTREEGYRNEKAL